jgi:hypothetical protein
MRRLALCLLLALALLLAAPVAAGEVWEKQLGESITATATDERGDRIFVGTESGMLCCYDSAGNVVWSQTLTSAAQKIVVDAEGECVMVEDSQPRLYNGATGTLIKTSGGGSPREGVIPENEGGHLLYLAWDSYIRGDSVASGYWAWSVLSPLGITPDGLTVSGDASWFIVNKDSDLRLYSLSLKKTDSWIAPYTYSPYNYRASHTITGTTGALTNYPVEITVIRGAGSSSGSTVYAPECRADFNDIRFTAADGVTPLPYYRESVVGSTATFLVNIPSIPESPGTTTIYVYWGNYANPPNTSDPAAKWILYDDFEDGVINTSLWTVSTVGSGSSVTESNGYIDIYNGGEAASTYAQLSGPTLRYGAYRIIGNVSFHEAPGAERNTLPSLDGEWPGVFSESASGGQRFHWREYTTYTTTLNTPQVLDARYTPGGSATYSYGSDWNVTRSPGATLVPVQFRAGHYDGPYSGHMRIYDIGITSYNSATLFLRSWGPVESVVTPLDTKTLNGTIIDIDAPETGDWVAVSTTTKTYIIEIADSGFGTVYSADRTGTPYDLAIANNGANTIEGRGILADIFRFDGVQTGTYTAGGPVRAVAIAQKNGLYAAAGSDDGKYYILSKDESSSWYLLHGSDSEDSVTAIAMSWRGEIAIIGRADGSVIAFRVTEEEITGSIRVTVFKDNIPYRDATIYAERSDGNGEFGPPLPYITDSYGAVTIPTNWGNRLRITADDETREIIATPTQLEYVIRIKGPVPLRTGAQYSSTYDDLTQRIYLDYDDTRDKTHHVTYKIIRAADNTEVFNQSYTDADLPLHVYYQIPAGWTNTSYRVHLTASGSPSFTNTWSQWVGTAGIAELPGELDNFARMGIALFLILFLAGLFSYYTGPQGAVVVSLFTGALVLWGWLPLPPAVVALAIIWAFLGLLGRTSGET